MNDPCNLLSRRDLLRTTGTGLGLLALPALLQAEEVASSNPLAVRSPHFAPRAKHLVHIYLNGGPSQVDTWDPKTELTKWGGQEAAAGQLDDGTGDRRGVGLAVSVRSIR